MIIHFQTVQDTLIALGSLIGVAVVFALAIISASWLGQRTKTPRMRAGRPATATVANVSETREPVLGKAA